MIYNPHIFVGKYLGKDPKLYGKLKYCDFTPLHGFNNHLFGCNIQPKKYIVTPLHGLKYQLFGHNI